MRRLSPQWSHGLQTEIAAANGPFILLFEQDGPTKRITDSRLGKMPTTSVQRRISRFRRSNGFVEWTHTCAKAPKVRFYL